MTEIYPLDNELLNLTAESETGVEYIPTGTAPYYLHFRKLIYRLLLACRRGNDLRLFSEGGLSVGVKPGKFWNCTQLVSYAGSSGNVLADNKSAIYVYLDSSGSLVTNEYSAFPSMLASAHVRLAIVSTSGGAVSSIVDVRDHHSISIPAGAGGIRRVIEAHTANDTLASSESGSIHTNAGSTGIVTLLLPSNAPAGTEFTFAVQAAQELRIDPGTMAILDSSGQTADKYKSASAIGSAITLAADSTGNWVTINKTDTWTEEA